MKKFMQQLAYWADRVGYYLARVTMIPTVILMGSMTLVVLIGVVFRYMVRSPLGWTEELARYLMIWSALLSVSIGIYYKEHVGITILIKRLPLPLARVISALTNILILYFLYVLMSRGYGLALRGKNQIAPSLGITMYWPLMSIPVSACIAIVQQALQIITDLFKKQTIRELVGEMTIEEMMEKEGLNNSGLSM